MPQRKAGLMGWAVACFSAAGACLLVLLADKHPHPYVGLAGLYALMAGICFVLAYAWNWKRSASGAKNDTSDAAIMGGGEFRGP